MTTPSLMIPLFKYARTSRNTDVSLTRLLSRSIRMSWLTRSKNFSRSTSTTTRRPACTWARACFTASWAPRPGLKPWLLSLNVAVQHGLQHLPQRLLDQPIHHRRDAQLALRSVRLRDHHPPYRTRPVRPLQQLFSHARPRPCWPSRASTPSAGSLSSAQRPATRQSLHPRSPTPCPVLHHAGLGLRR